MATAQQCEQALHLQRNPLIGQGGNPLAKTVGRLANRLGQGLPAIVCVEPLDLGYQVVEVVTPSFISCELALGEEAGQFPELRVGMNEPKGLVSLQSRP